MNIDIKKSAKPVKYIKAIEFLEKRVIDVSLKKKNELIWILEHPLHLLQVKDSWKVKY